MIRNDHNDKIFRTENEKKSADLILECSQKGQPVLVSTSSVDKSEVYSSLLRKKKKKKIIQ